MCDMVPFWPIGAHRYFHDTLCRSGCISFCLNTLFNKGRPVIYWQYRQREFYAFMPLVNKAFSLELYRMLSVDFRPVRPHLPTP